MTKKITGPTKRRNAGALVQATDPSEVLAAIDRIGVKRAKIGASMDTSVIKQEGAVMASSVSYHTADHIILNAQVFFRPDDKPNGNGPWLGEADKVAWRDTHSGYECIMLREPGEGYLGGYVGIPESHPLYGFDHRAIPPVLGIAVHGGLSYSKICKDGPSPAQRYVSVESRRICHTRDVRYLETRHAGDYRVEQPNAWWFGFECNHLYDQIPDQRSRSGFMAAETEAIYRDDAYVVREIMNLASQLKAIADGEPMPVRQGPPLPPIGLEPDQGI